MSGNQSAPYGSWQSPLSAAQVAGGQIGLDQVEVNEGMVYWAESRPEEGGRVAIMMAASDGSIREATPPNFNCRTRVHEYGGGAYLVSGRAVLGSRFEDQRLYRIEAGEESIPITPEPGRPAGLRYADGRAHPEGEWLICVREDHGRGSEPANELVLVARSGEPHPQALQSGRDFYSTPRISPAGDRLAWLAWDHPRMPWEGTELWMADLGPLGELSNPEKVAGSEHESIFQPEWSREGVLHFVSDRDRWWNLYRWDGGQVHPVSKLTAELGSPQWIFGLSRYAFLADGTIACICTQNGLDRLGTLDPRGEFLAYETEYTSFRPHCLRYDDHSDRLVFIAAGPRSTPAVATLQPSSGEIQVIRPSSPMDFDPGDISQPEVLQYPSQGGRTAHAFFYPPTNSKHKGPDGERPPLIVISHGGPTSQARAEFALPLQYWTTRGFAVVDVNYGGSTGFGRQYRELLNGNWGTVDVEDCIHAARHLADRGDVDPGRLIIRGGSAGGYTTLSALVFHRAFAAGASYYGVADVELLAQDTHKFESRYLDSMIGPYPQAAELYRARSPIHFADQLSCPVILFQGSEDKVVPPTQAETMVEALQAKGLPHAYLAFEGEAHGFRSAANIRRALEAELYFYSKIFGFELAEEIEPVEIRNFP